MASGPPSPSNRDLPTGSPRRALIAVALGMAAMTALVLAVDPLRSAVGDAVTGDTGALREDLRDLGVGGAALLFAVMMVHTFVWYPAEIVDAAAGFVYDLPVALALVMSGWIIQGLLAYSIGRTAARPLLYRFIGEERFGRAERAIEEGGVTLLLAARLVPIVPFSLFSYVAGAARVPVSRFAWTTALGYLPITAIFIYLGSRLESLSLTDPALWGGVLAVIGLLLLTRRLRPLIAGEPDRPDGSR